MSILELALFSEDVGAARTSYKEKFKLKLKHANHIDRHPSSCMATEFGQLDLVNNLLQNNTLDVNAATNKTGGTALHYAMKTDYSEVVTFLLERGAHRDSTDSEGRTALGLSVYTTETDFLSILLWEGFDMATEDLQGYSVWHLAAEVNDVQAMQMLGDFSVHDDHSYPSDFQPNDLFT